MGLYAAFYSMSSVIFKIKLITFEYFSPGASFSVSEVVFLITRDFDNHTILVSILHVHSYTQGVLNSKSKLSETTKIINKIVI